MLEIRILLIALMYVSSTVCAPSTGPDINSLVVATTEAPVSSFKEGAAKEGTKEIEDVLTVPKIYDMKVVSNIANRFATTHITSRVKNVGQSAQQATFFVILPETAYISGFVMEIGRKNYTAYVKEKEEAKQIYNQAVESGVAAAHVEAKARDSNKFTVSVNIEPQSKATFYLTYEELIKRQRGQYEVVINIHPGQLVKNLGIEVNVNETRPLKFVKQVPFLRSGNEISKNDDRIDTKANVQVYNGTSAKVTFNPDLEDQRAFVGKLGGKEGDGLAGQFVLQYDVEREPLKGEVLVSDGYFVHFFAPSDVPPLNKHVVFILDTSGSMYRRKIEQLKTAMKSILGDLKKEDTFNIVEFNTFKVIWNITEKQPEMATFESENQTKVVEITDAFHVTDQNIKNAKEIIDGLVSGGDTNIQVALEAGLDLIKKAKSANKNSNQPIIVFLTDGQGRLGDDFISSFTESNKGTTPIFPLSFGNGADRDFLQKLSLKNQGFERHIYEAADASLQLEAFYQQISSPLLSDVHFKYVSKNITKVTRSTFPIWFGGSELVVAGNYHGDYFHPPIVTGQGRRGPVELQTDVNNPIGSLERLWAYLTVQQLLEKRNGATNKEKYTKQALEIALKYSFVTPISSLVVVKPNNTKSEENMEDASKDNTKRISIGRGFKSGMKKQYLRRRIIPNFIRSHPWSYLKKRLPWLANVVDANETMTLPLGTYKLGFGVKVPNHPECTPSASQEKGTCRLLHDCPEIYFILNSTEIYYVNYFCPLNEYAGVCCPTTATTGLSPDVP